MGNLCRCVRLHARMSLQMCAHMRCVCLQKSTGLSLHVQMCKRAQKCAGVSMQTWVRMCTHAGISAGVRACKCACTGAGFTYRSMCAKVHACMEACRCVCKGAQVQEACRCLCRAARELAHAYARACEHTFRCPQLCACAFGSNASPRDLRSTRGRSAPCASRGSGSAALHSG